MNSQSNVLAIWRNLASVVCLLAFGFLVTGSVRAQSGRAAAGELASANRATINGSPAISGMTVFSNNRIRAAERGAAIVNLSKLGRLELGAETDLTLRFSTGNLGGELHSGRAVVSAPAGVVISVSTAKGLVATDGLQAAVLTIEVDSKRARVVSYRGKASLNSGGRIERIGEAEEIALEPRGDGWKHRRLIAPGIAGAAGAAGIAIAGQLAGQAAKPGATAGSPTTSTFTSLLSASVKSSAQQVTASKGLDSNQSFETTMSCRDHSNNKCKKKSKKKPGDDDDDDDDQGHGNGNGNGNGH